MRILMGNKQYFVKYVGLPSTRCEWVSPESIEEARDKIDQFHDQSGAKNLGKRNCKMDLAKRSKIV
jgi:ribosomal protein L16/L10AE